jgi:signal transduction histidine kinase
MELHDAVTQKLFSLRLTADAASALVERDPARAVAELATVRKLAAEATEELRAIVVEARPADLRGDGLDIALRKQAELLDRVHEPTIRYTSCHCVPALTEARQQAVYRIAQEAVHNALRHAAAARVDVSMLSHNGSVVLEVRDDGAGFDPSSALGSAQGSGRRLGLASMRERARAAGGRLDVTSEPGRGTTVRLEVPTGG